MTARSVIVIGAGLAGLAAGCYVRMNGYQARIFEHAEKPGGVAATWQRQGYTIDGGIHFYSGCRPSDSFHRLYRELGLARDCRFSALRIYNRYLDEATGQVLEVSGDLDRLAADLTALSPQDAGFVSQFIAGAKAFKGFDMGVALAKPPELANWRDKARLMWQSRKTYRYFSGRHNQPMGQAVSKLRNPFLKWVLENLFLPQVPVSFVMMLLGSLAKGDLGLGLDGSAGFVGAMEKRFTELGGQITYQATVEKILVENDRAVGVRLKGGQEHKADTVIGAADGRSTIFKMLGGGYLDETIRERYQTWPLFAPILLISYGVKREFPGQACFTVVRLKEPLLAGWLKDGWLSVRLFNYSPIFAPPGKTVVQIMAETEWQPWLDLRQNMDAYRVAKEKVAAGVLARLDRLWPGLAGQVEMIDVATPYTTWRYTLNHQGAFEGFLPTPKTVWAEVPRTLPGLKNFYMAGQWVMPGGGVAPCLASGRHAAMLLCRDSGQPFRTEEV